jgi:hypothetical protein
VGLLSRQWTGKYEMRASKNEYILRNLSKIKHKKWELFVITRIIYLLNDPEIEYYVSGEEPTITPRISYS